MIAIYKIISPTGKIYIGQTKNYEKRMYLYKKLCCKTQQRLYNSLKKYGFNNHACEIIEQVDSSKSDEREQYWIRYFKSYWKDDNKGLNLNRGGYRPKQTEETKRKISQAILGSKNVKAKKLYQYTKDNQLVKVWDCMNDIQRELGYVTTWLSKATKNNKVAYGFRWFYEPLPD